MPPKIYDVDPFAEVFCLRENVYSIFTESADGMGDTWHHLIVGTEQALLIDTGFGIGNLKGLADVITGHKPLLVAITHEHLDHSYGNYQFDRVFCHEFAIPVLESKLNPQIWDNLTNSEGKGIWLRFEKADLIRYQEYDIIGCPNHFVFELGPGHEVEMVHVPGHAPGGTSFIDKKNRILFTGAFHSNYVSVGCNPKKRETIPHKEYASVTAFLRGLKDLESRLHEFDYIFPAHEILDIDQTMVTDMVRLCESVIADPNEFDFCATSKNDVVVRYKASGLGSLRFIQESIM